MDLIDSLLNRITMYRLVFYDLIAMLAAAAGLSFAGVLHLNPWAIGLSAGYLTGVCWVTNQILARVYRTPTNPESTYITALILALIISPPNGPHDWLLLTAAGGLAMASKYLLAIRHRHIFNPAAIAVVLTALVAHQAASWWVGSEAMLPFVALGGLLVVRKVQRGRMVTALLAVSVLGVAAGALATHGDVGATLKITLLESPLIYFASIMFTEPQTSPGTLNAQFVFAGLVGLLALPFVHVGGLYFTPELALVTGNLLAFVISRKPTLSLRLKQQLKLAPDIAEFVFQPERPLQFRPGQYMEFTLPHRQRDRRGSRRFFTLASSPTEPDLRLGVRFYPKGSSYKRALQLATENTAMAAGNLGGDFILPEDPHRKLVLIAGGIGVTPYRSMIKFLIDTNQPRDIVLLYAEKTRGGLVYTDIFEQAKARLGVKPVYVLSEESVKNDPQVKSGLITAELIRTTVPDWAERTFYVSGSHAVVQAIKRMLLDIGVDPDQIKTDFFPGYV